MIKCPNCAKENPDYIIRCVDCGKRISDGPSKPTLIDLIANIAVFLVALAGVTAAVLYEMGKSNERYFVWMWLLPEAISMVALPGGIIALCGIARQGRRGLLWKGLIAVFLPMGFVSAPFLVERIIGRELEQRQALAGQFAVTTIAASANESRKTLSLEYPADWILTDQERPTIRAYRSPDTRRKIIMAIRVMRMPEGMTSDTMHEMLRDPKFAATIMRDSVNLKTESIGGLPNPCALVDYDLPTTPEMKLTAHIWAYFISIDHYNEVQIVFTGYDAAGADRSREWAETRLHIVRSVKTS